MGIHSAGLKLAETTASLRQRFEAMCAQPSDNGCIGWLGQKTRKGYGLIRLGGKDSLRTTAHRVAWALKRGDLSPEILVLHKCDNPSCVNAEHLFIGTQKDNMADMRSKRRHPWRNGAPWQKLTSEDGERIREMRRAGQTQQQIADSLGVSRPLISMILAGKIQHSAPLAGQ
jgi:hypothetical protein